MKLTDKSNEVFEYVKNNGGRVSIPELASALDRTERSVGANVTDLTKKGLAARDDYLCRSYRRRKGFCSKRRRGVIK